jgi:hypothetical protein
MEGEKLNNFLNSVSAATSGPPWYLVSYTLVSTALVAFACSTFVMFFTLGVQKKLSKYYSHKNVYRQTGISSGKQKAWGM